MRDHRKEFRLSAMCRALEVSAAGYYAWRARQPSKREKENQRLVERIKATHTGSRGNYGSPKVYRKLRREGERVSRKRVARLMKEHGITARRVKKSKRTTDTRHSLPVAENILARNFKVTCPETVWTSEITYVWTAEGWMYLVVFLDLYARLVVGWAMSESLVTEFVERAFLQGQTRRGQPVSPLMHSDRGRKSRECGLSGTAFRVGLLSEHESQGRRLGQRRDGELLRHPEE